MRIKRDTEAIYAYVESPSQSFHLGLFVMIPTTNVSIAQTRETTRRSGGKARYAGRTTNEGRHRSSKEIERREEERIPR